MWGAHADSRGSPWPHGSKPSTFSDWAIPLILMKMITSYHHDGSVGEWMYLTICPLHSPGSIPGHGGVFQGIFFPGWSHAGASRESLNDAPWETPSQRLSRSISAPLLTVPRAPAGYLHHYWQLSRAPAGYMHHSWQLSRVPGSLLTAVQGTCRIPASLLTAVQGTCRVPASLPTAVQVTWITPDSCPGHLQGTCITPDSCPGHLQGTCTSLDSCSVMETRKKREINFDLRVDMGSMAIITEVVIQWYNMTQTL